MRAASPLVAIALLLSACGDGDATKRPEVSYRDAAPLSGMTYGDFRRHEDGAGDMDAAQKRFLTLDRDNNGRLTPDEFQ